MDETAPVTSGAVFFICIIEEAERENKGNPLPEELT
jgi:hypothetical protein